MSTKQQKMQAIIRNYKQETGKTEIDMHDVAAYAISKGWRAPTPPSAVQMLQKEFSEAARQEYRRDPRTGRSYRANHAVATRAGSRQMVLWIDLDEAPRALMLKSLTQRREQMVGDAYHLSIDAERWNSIHPDEEAIQLALDFAPDVTWRKGAEESEDNAA
jgi:hypothetical protein